MPARYILNKRLTLAFLAAGVVLVAQTSRYGPSRIWWDAGQTDSLGWDSDFDNPSGQVRISNKNGAVKTEGHPFFAALGTNGRACVTCHQPANAMSVSAEVLRQRWLETEGKDPVFAMVDGANCPDQPPAQRASHSLLLDRGLFRIALPWPPPNVKPDFEIEVVRDPAGCNLSPKFGLAAAHQISVYRRPRMAANLAKLTEGPKGAVLMADGREPSLRSQAITAAFVHEESPRHLTVEELDRILDFETQVYAAQNSDMRGGLVENSGLGVEPLMNGPAPSLFAGLDLGKWKGIHETDLQREFRASAARGSKLFASRAFRMDDVSEMTCATCHQPGTKRLLDIGTARHPQPADSPLPLFRLKHGATVVYSEDPGRALITGRFADAGVFAMPQFRALAARAPYFTNGAAASLRAVVDYYDRTYESGLSEAEKRDLTNFLSVL